MSALLALRAAWPAVIRAAPLVALGVLLAACLVQRHTITVRTDERDAERATNTEFRQMVTDATVPADAKGRRRLLTVTEARAALTASFRDRDDARGALARIGQNTAAAHGRSEAADNALAHTQAGLEAQRQRSLPVIHALEAARAPGTENGDAALIANASDDAWSDWR